MHLLAHSPAAVVFVIRSISVVQYYSSGWIEEVAPTALLQTAPPNPWVNAAAGYEKVLKARPNGGAVRVALPHQKASVALCVPGRACLLLCS